MRILFGIAVHMVHTVQYGVGTWIQKRRPLRKPGKKIKQPLSFLSGCIHLMRSIPVQEKSMKEEG